MAQLSEQAYKTAAKTIGCDVAIIKAVDEVESSGKGIIDGKPVILFEPHIFWKQLKAVGITPKVSEFCYPVWGTKPYPGGQAAQWARLDKAAAIHRNAALLSCSWGRFQIMGFNHKTAGFPVLQSFINAMYKSEDVHLQAFVSYVINARLDDELKYKDWAGFARGYNGALYWKNNYDKKLKAAYLKYA